jgi:polyphosphate kinase
VTMTQPVIQPPSGQTFINRELSWLAFNERVLEEAADSRIPLLERCKFAAIASSNLDEFFMVRVAALQQATHDGDATPDPSGLTALQQLTAVRARAQLFVAALYRVVNGELLPGLAARQIRLIAYRDLDHGHCVALHAFFQESILPILTPLAIDISRPFPLLSSLTLNVAVLLQPAAGESKHRLGIVQVPAGLARLVRLAGGDGVSFVLLEHVIQAHLSQLFPGQDILESAVIRLSRDAELEFDDEGGRTQLELVEREVRRRRRRDVVRLEIEAAASPQLVELLVGQLDVTADDVFAVAGPIDLRVLMGLVDLPGFAELRDPPIQPVNFLSSATSDLFAVLDEGDVLLHHPYDSYDPVVAFLSQAADDPDVLAIKQTLYRTSGGSQVIASLQRAAERNKQVTVIVELTARFDEERNIHWARALEEAGAHVIYGVRGYKVHAKMCLVVKRTANGLRRYVHLGTGNYNERTARTYTDFGLLTASPIVAEDVSAVFSSLTGYSDPPRLKQLVMAPTGLRQRFLKLIDREKRRATSGQPAEIVAKMNSLLDVEIIARLYEASQAGVRIRLNVRGMCALRPGVSGLSDNIVVVSVVDRFLEHSRIYYFLNGGEEVLYLASADWMARNLDRRVELMFPVETPEHKGRILSALRMMFSDTEKSRWLDADGVYRRRPPSPREPRCRVQEALHQEGHRLASLALERKGVTFRPERADTDR